MVRGMRNALLRDRKENMGLLISVIIPIYNVEPYLRQCLDSVANQTYQNLEIILIDDGSPDTCGAICDEYASRDHRIRVIHKRNGGVGAARNDGIRAAAGEWIAFVDPDDWLELNYYEQMVSLIPTGGADVLCVSGNYNEQRSGPVVARIFDVCDAGLVDRQTLIKKTLVPGYGLKELCDKSNLSVPWNKLFRTAFLKKEHIEFDLLLHPGEDTIFNLSVFERANDVVACECIGYHYRTYIETASMNRFNPNWPSMRKRYIEKLVAILSRQPDKNDYQEALIFSAFKLMETNLRCYFFHPSNSKPYSEVAAELRAMKHEPLFHAAIWNHKNAYLSWKEILLKHVLRLPWVWPVKLCYMGKRFVDGTHNR